MIGLKSIETDIQNIAEAISCVLKVDVTIVDEDLVRIAGTGAYVSKIGEKVSRMSAFGSSMDTGRSFIIENPRLDDVCRRCSMKYECVEWGEVCCPIKLEGSICGVIGLIAFDEQQRANLLENKAQLLNFLGKMSELISSKLRAEEKASMLKLETSRMQTLINNMDKAVVSVSNKGHIDSWNQKFVDLFRQAKKIEGKSIFDILNFIKPEELEGAVSSKRSAGFVYNKGSHSFRGIYNINAVIIDGKAEGFVLDFVDAKSAINDYNEIAYSESGIGFESIIGSSEPLSNAIEQAKVASRSASSVLITGESGTGKELFARAIHSASSRNSHPFIAINCAAIPEALLESELFGYEEGAFTGAKKGGKLGKFELADKGTLFLDEIGDMSLHLQAKLLRVLQEKKIDKIGSSSSTPVDVRILSATNRNLEEMVEKREFREDLYYRLNVIPIRVPPLRERMEDIPELLMSIARECSQNLGKSVEGFSDSVMDIVMAYEWPGNVRELQNVIEYCINMTKTGVIVPEDLPEKLKTARPRRYEQSKYQGIMSLGELEKAEIQKALFAFKDYKQDKEKAAQALGISRATLYRKIKEYGIISN
ncbi:putative sigma-54-dependent transcriptional regulator YgeV [Peptoclostridium acidaminophilum DSM 3953]|uniref:Putative sigma-54-dependent transcriptional regulator YgeV n=1 Tax=Peptoclostridium acidaminophilum DSM 3953 TaxID=1286171 RepID=W8U7N3_PEPAC|nr:sigma 54-interacting transcriptional regulator [Peptoclostridium acidaminophilum]AHM56891.1 putative sigma-54-dependent transcriptional regulator YgeV [Peptoclostridium acidaminophilum DSM 3953]